MDIRLDKYLSFGAAMHDRKFQQILPNVNLRNKGIVPAVPLGGHFKYPGKIFDFKSLNSVPKKEFEVKLGKSWRSFPLLRLGAKLNSKYCQYMCHLSSILN